MPDARIQDDFFGELRCYDQSCSVFGKVMEFAEGHLVGISISIDGIDQATVLSEMRTRYLEIQKQEPSYRQLAAVELVDDWRKHSKTKLVASEIEGQIGLQSMEFFPDHKIELWYEQTGLFPGHRIVITVNWELVYQCVELASY